MRGGVADLVDALARSAGEPRDAVRDPYAVLVHENAGYLVDDERRDALFARIVALAPDPLALIRADGELLFAIARDGGMRPEERVIRLREIAMLSEGATGGDLAAMLRALPLATARRFLRRYPAIGEPGADRVLLFAGIAGVPSIESNGLRVLERNGFVAGTTPYATQYRDAVKHLGAAFGSDGPALRRAYRVLRRHGKATCRRTAPACLRCPVRDVCPAGRWRSG